MKLTLGETVSEDQTFARIFINLPLLLALSLHLHRFQLDKDYKSPSWALVASSRRDWHA